MSLPLLRLRIDFLIFFVVFAELAGSAAAQDVTLRWYPATGSAVAGYKAYIARSGSGPLVAAAIDLGRPAPGSDGVASVRLRGVDRTAPLLSIELTSYDSLGRESMRSNRVLLTGDRETVAEPGWSADFEDSTDESHYPGFLDYRGAFAVRELSDESLVVGSPVPATDALAVSRFVGDQSSGWAPYELEGRMMVLLGSTASGVALRASAYLNAGFLLGGDGAGEFALDQLGKPELTCSDSPSTGVRISRGRWYRFRVRHTAPGGVARLRVKIWRPTEIEPSLWQADCWTDVPAASDTGAFALYQAGSGITYWDDLVVRTVTGTYSQPPSY